MGEVDKMSKQEIAEYKAFTSEIRDTLELQYQMALYNNDLEAAYNNLGKMMEYKVISIDDPRIEKNNRSFKAAGIDKDHRFRYDYRKDTSYLAGWIYGDLEISRSINCNTIEHWGKRVEGNYEGDTTFASFPINVRFHLCTTVKQVNNALEGISKLFKENGQNLRMSSISEECTEGVYRIYEIEVNGNCINNFRKFGYILVRMGDNCIECNLILRYASIIGNWLPLDDTIKQIQETARHMCHDGNIKFKTQFDASGARTEQLGMINASKATNDSHDRLVKELDNKEKKK